MACLAGDSDKGRIEEMYTELVQLNRDLPLEGEVVTAAVDDWIGVGEQPDDVTLVLARAR